MKRILFAAALALAMQASAADKWTVVWTGSTHGPYPAGNPVAQPDLSKILPGNTAEDMSLRMIVKPGLWTKRVRIRFSNIFGDKPLTLDGAFAGVHGSAGMLLTGTNTPVKFNGGKTTVTIPPGELLFSDAVDLRLPKGLDLTDRHMAVSFHIAGNSGPLTWHAKALKTSYLTASRGGSHGAEESADAFPFTTTSLFVVDAVEAMAPASTRVVMGFGDSITDGTNSTINGDDRWPDFLTHRLRAAKTPGVVVVNAGIGGNRVISPAKYDPAKPIAGGPSALERLERDVLSLGGITTVVWLEGINDLGAGLPPAAIIEGFKQGVQRMKSKGIRVLGATVTSALGSNGASGTPEKDMQRKTINDFIRTGGLFDAVVDFDAATLDKALGTLKPEYQPNSSIGGPGDKLHPNRAGYQTMANAIDLKVLFTR